MFCPNCAQPVRDGAKFCEFCGFPLATIQTPVAAPVEPEPVAAEPEPVVAEPVVVAEPEPVVEPVVAVEPEPVVEPVVAVEPEPVAEPVVAVEPEPAAPVYQAPAQPVYQAPAQPTYQQPVQPQATYAAYQQPAQPTYQQPVQPQATYAAYQQQPQPTYQQAAPQAPNYAQNPAYAQTNVYAQNGVVAAEKKPFTKSVWFKVLIGLVAAIALFAIVKAVTQGLNISGLGGTLDSNGNPTANAIMNKDGAELTEALEKAGWTFDEDTLIWMSDDGNNGYYVCGPDDYEFTRNDIKSMSANGGRDAAIMTLLVDDYKYDSLEDVVDKIVGDNVTVLDKESDSDCIFLILQNASGDKDFALVTHDTDSGLYRLDIANPASITSGYTEDFFGLYGTTLDDLWYDATGRSIAED